MSAKHHCVSQFHLRQFVDPDSLLADDPWLWVGDVVKNTVKRRAPKNIGWERGLFDRPGALDGADASIEKHLATEVEGPAACALRTFCKTPQ